MTPTAGRWPRSVDALRASRRSSGSAPWRHKVAETGGDAARADRSRRRAARLEPVPRRLLHAPPGADEDNRRAVEEAAALGARRARARLRAAASTRDLRARRAATIAAGIERLLPYATEHGVRLGIEPLHPMMVGERSAIVTLGEALDLAERIRRPDVGVVVDAYHVFWDPRPGAADRARAAAGSLGYHVYDWLVRHARPARRPRADGRRDHRPRRRSARSSRPPATTARSRSRSSTLRSPTCPISWPRSRRASSPGRA